jgi:hypothetical protein
MKRLKAATRKHQVQLRVAIKTQADKEMTLLRQSFDLWVRLERGRLLQRVRDTRVLRTSLSKWQSKLARVDKLQGRSLIVPSADLSVPAAAFAAASELKTLHSTLSRWRDVLGARRNAILKADLVFAFRTKHTTSANGELRMRKPWTRLRLQTRHWRSSPAERHSRCGRKRYLSGGRMPSLSSAV